MHESESEREHAQQHARAEHAGGGMRSDEEQRNEAVEHERGGDQSVQAVRSGVRATRAMSPVRVSGAGHLF